MIRILVISDNLHQYVAIKSVFAQNERDDIYVDYRHSHLKSNMWDHPDFSGKNKYVNVKTEMDILIENFDLIISVHCKQLFPAKLVNFVRCINIHPGYNPINRGWYPQVFAIINENKIGATIHEIDAELDHGPIIVREFVEQFDYDTSIDIYERV